MSVPVHLKTSPVDFSFTRRFIMSRFVYSSSILFVTLSLAVSVLTSPLIRRRAAILDDVGITVDGGTNVSSESSVLSRRAVIPSSKSSTPSSAQTVAARISQSELNTVSISTKWNVVGIERMLTQVVIVDSFGVALLECRIQSTDNDHTHVTGIEAQYMAPVYKSDHNVAFGDVQSKVIEHIQGKVLVGYALWNDFKILGLYHRETRDAALYEPDLELFGGRKPSLIQLAELHDLGVINLDNPALEDAKTTMDLYASNIFDIERRIYEGPWPFRDPPQTHEVIGVPPADFTCYHSPSFMSLYEEEELLR